jgi:TRAP transporter TAXI family solute receptor
MQTTRRSKKLLQGLNRTLIVMFVLSIAISWGSPMAEAASKLIAIAGGPSGGSYYPLSIGISEIITRNISDLKVDVAVTAGAVENCTLVGTGEADMAFTNGDAAYEAYTGTARYAGKKLPNMRILFGGVPGGFFHTAVAKKSGITSFSHLKGKRVAFGPQGSTTEYLAEKLFQYYGVKKGDMKLTYLSYSDGIQALVDGHVDAALVVAPLPAVAVKQLATVGKLDFTIVQVEENKAKQFVKDNPFYTIGTIPADMYGLGHTVRSIASTNIMAINAKLEADLVYQITKAIFANLDTLSKAHPAGKRIKLETAVVQYVPLHPGAEKYYRERGLLK